MKYENEIKKVLSQITANETLGSCRQDNDNGRCCKASFCCPSAIIGKSDRSHVVL